MPLLKGKGCKSMPDKAIAYITNDKKAEYVSSQNLDDHRSYSDQFKETSKLFGKGKEFSERKYYHFKLSCNRADNVSALSHQEYAEEVAKRFFSDYECVIATHTDTETIHSHIIVNAVNFENGKKLQINDRKYRRMKDIVNEIGLERGYSALDWRKAVEDKRSRLKIKPVTEANKRTTGELYIQHDHGADWGKYSWKEQLRQLIDQAKKQCHSREEFQAFLKEYGVEMPRNTAKSVSFVHPAVSKKSVRGNVLGAEYTASEIDKALKLNCERGINHAGYDIKENTITEGTAQADSRTETVRSRECSPESRLDGIERKVRGISQEVRGLTSEGRAEQAERARAMAQRNEAEQRRKQQEIERLEREAHRTAERDKQQREQSQECESGAIRHDYYRGR